MRSGSWALALVVSLGIAGNLRVVSHGAEEQTKELTPLEVLQDCAQAVEQKDFARYVDHLTPDEQRVQAGLVLLMTSQLLTTNIAAEGGPEVILLGRVLQDLANRHKRPPSNSSSYAPGPAPNQLVYSYPYVEPSASASNLLADTANMMDHQLRASAGVLKSPRDFLIDALGEVSRPAVVSGREPKPMPGDFDLNAYAKAFRGLSCTAYARGDYAIVVAASPGAVQEPAEKPGPAAAPKDASQDRAPQLYIDFRKIDGAWKIDHLLPIVMVTAGSSANTTMPSRPYNPSTVSPPNHR